MTHWLEELALCSPLNLSRNQSISGYCEICSERRKQGPERIIGPFVHLKTSFMSAKLI